MFTTVYCVIGLIIFLVNVWIMSELLKENLPVVTNAMVFIAFVASFFAGVLWPITVIYGICKNGQAN